MVSTELPGLNTGITQNALYWNGIFYLVCFQILRHAVATTGGTIRLYLITRVCVGGVGANSIAYMKVRGTCESQLCVYYDLMI